MVDIFKRAFNQSECVSNIVVSLPDFYIPVSSVYLDYPTHFPHKAETN